MVGFCGGSHIWQPAKTRSALDGIAAVSGRLRCLTAIRDPMLASHNGRVDPQFRGLGRPILENLLGTLRASCW